MALASYIGKLSRVSGNILGLKKELETSVVFHFEGVPLLVSPNLLRERSMGQIDLARIRRNNQGLLIIEILEVKSSVVGEEMINRGQRSRLHSTQDFLSSLFGLSSKLIHQS